MSDPTPTCKVHTRIFVYSHPRTRSNLFMKLLETHPHVMAKSYPFMWAFQHGPDGQWSEEDATIRLKASGQTKEQCEKKYSNATYQSGLDDIERLIAKASAEGKICIIKEHTAHILESRLINANIPCPRHETPCPTFVDKKLDMVGSEIEMNTSFPIPNPSLLPDRIAAFVSPVIIIRHPMFVLPSYARAWAVYDGNVFEAEFWAMTTYRWQRMIYDFYRAYYDKVDPEGEKRKWPVVVDGEKLVEDTHGQMKKFCTLVGLDECLVQYTWDPPSVKIADNAFNAFTGTIANSTGVIRGSDISNTNLDEEVKKWTEEWNEEVAQKMKEVVESFMEDYEYLLGFSI